MPTLARSSALIISAERKRLEARIMASNKPYYVYILCRPDRPGPDLTPFYVGKGSSGRFGDHEDEARRSDHKKTHKLNLIRLFQKTGQQIVCAIDSFHDDEDVAYAREKALIDFYGRHDLRRGCLTNHDNGGRHGGEWSDEIRARHLDTLGGTEGDSERAVLNRFFREFDNAASKPIKPLSEWERNVHGVEPHRNPREATRRACAAIACLAMAHGQILRVGTQLPRRLVHEGIPAILENGASSDILGAGIAVKGPGIRDRGHEVYILTKYGLESVVKLIGEDKLTAAGIYLVEEANIEVYRERLWKLKM